MGYSNRYFYENIRAQRKTKVDVPCVDAHLHVVDFLQEGGRAKTPVWSHG